MPVVFKGIEGKLDIGSGYEGNSRSCSSRLLWAQDTKGATERRDSLISSYGRQIASINVSLSSLTHRIASSRKRQRD